jgi:tRNA/tmRNA/rRNA uracil-C5-methylase (TrmA/RlmC/RlmD family)
MSDPTQKRQPPRGFVAKPFAYHEEIELQIDTLTNMGQGLGRIDCWVVMVPFALPGERVCARIFRNHKNYSDADLIEVITPSPDRREAKCQLFGRCGGCQYQHLDYEKQIEWKRRQVAELLQHMAKLDDIPVEPVIGSPNEWHYRSKITPHFQKPKKGKIESIGFLSAQSRHLIIDVPSCPIATETINVGLANARRDVFENASRYKKGATLLLRDAAGTLATNPNEPITEVVAETRFEFLAGSFFQNNPFILPAFAGYVAEQARSSACRFLVDAYCGSGLFCLTAAKHFEKVAGIEISESAIEWARRNAELNGIENCDLHAGSAENIFGAVAFPNSDTSVIIDPPRKGCNAAFIEQLIQFSPAIIVYVSCNPSTQIRDLSPLMDAGYIVERIQPFDLFPQTKHLECVITLKSGF